MLNFVAQERVSPLVLLLAVSVGMVGESLLVVRHQCRQIRSAMAEQFQVVTFLSSDVTAAKAKVVEEKLRTLPGVVTLRYLAREALLGELKRRDPDMVRAVSLLGENPMPSAFEIQLSPETLAGIVSWAQSAARIPEIYDVRFQPSHAHAISQLEVYGRFLDVLVSLAATVWLLTAAAGLWLSAMRRPQGRFLQESLVRCAVAAVGASAGLFLVYLTAWPLQSEIELWTWPGYGEQLRLILVLAMGIGFSHNVVWSPKRVEKGPAENLPLPSEQWARLAGSAS